MPTSHCGQRHNRNQNGLRSGRLYMLPGDDPTATLSPLVLPTNIQPSTCQLSLVESVHLLALKYITIKMHLVTNICQLNVICTQHVINTIYTWYIYTRATVSRGIQYNTVCYKNTIQEYNLYKTRLVVSTELQICLHSV